MPSAGVLIGILVFVVLFVLLLLTVVGFVASLLSAPVFWVTGFGFVPHEYVLSTESAGELSFLVLGHVVGGTVVFVASAGLGMALDALGAGEWARYVGLPAVLLLAWLILVARPLRGNPDSPAHWVRDSLGAFVLYGACFLVVTGMVSAFSRAMG